MRKVKKNTFWKIILAWYFFPLIYVVLIFLIFIYLEGYKDVNPLKIFFLMLYLVPNGLVYFYYQTTGEKPSVIFGNLVPMVYFAIMLIGLIGIQYFKTRKISIARWLTISILIILLLTFFGCAAGNWDKATYFEPISLFG